MTRYPVQRLLALLFLLPISPIQANPPDGYDILSYDQGMEQARREGKTAFLYFGRYGCGYCTRTNVETFSDPGLKDLYSRNYVMIYVDAEGGRRMQLPNGERITEAELGARLNVYATPLFLYLSPEGETLLRVPGFKTVQDFVDFDRYIQGGHYRNESINDFLARPSAGVQ